MPFSPVYPLYPRQGKFRTLKPAPRRVSMEENFSDRLETAGESYQTSQWALSERSK